MPGPPQRIDDFTVSVPADSAVIGPTRQRFCAWLQRVAPAGDEAADDLAVVLSELLANAVRAAASTERGTVQILGCLDHGAIVLEVRNPTAEWVDTADRWDLGDPLRPGGRGLVIVESLVDELSIEHDIRDGTTTVRSRRELAQRG